MNDEYIPKIAMSIHAHPDDQEFTIGGTLAKWARAGCEIISVVITSGDSGSNDPAKDGSHKKELADLREQEQLAANAVLGIKETVFLRYPDGELEPTLALRKDLTPAGAVALLVFFAFAMQCMSTVAVVRRETGGWRWPLMQFAYMGALAYSGAFLANHLVG